MDEFSALLLYILGVNLATFILMGVDKRKSKNQAWRIPERTFWGLSIIGGAIGSLLGMKVYRHKTKHRLFTMGMPIIIIIQLLLFLYIIYSLS